MASVNWLGDRKFWNPTFYEIKLNFENPGIPVDWKLYFDHKDIRWI